MLEQKRPIQVLSRTCIGCFFSHLNSKSVSRFFAFECALLSQEAFLDSTVGHRDASIIVSEIFNKVQYFLVWREHRRGKILHRQSAFEYIVYTLYNEEITFILYIRIKFFLING